MADELRVIITADASGVGPAVAQATAAVQASAEQISAAQAKATAATKLLTQAQIELGAAAEAGNAQAAAIIQEYAASSAEATAAVTALTGATQADTAATVANAGAQRADTTATFNRTEAMGAARVAMGAMDGSMGMMGYGLARIAAGSSVLGPILANMVPVAVIAAGVFLLYDLGEAIYKAFDLGGDGAREFEQKLSSLDESYRSLIDNTSLEGDKIQAAIAKLEEVPNPNAIKEAIDEALVEADKMDDKLQGLISKEESLLKMQSLAGSTAQRLTETTGDKQAQIDAEQHALWLAKETTLQGQLGEVTRARVDQERKLRDLQFQQRTSIDPGQFDNAIQATQILIADRKKDAIVLEQSIANQKNSADLTYLTTTKQIEQEEKARTISHKAAQEQIADAEKVRAASLSAIGSSVTAPPPLPPISQRATKSDNLPEQIAKAQIEATHAADAQLAPEQQIVAAMDKQIELNNLKATTTKEGTAAEREQLRVVENQVALAKAKEQIDALGKDRLNATFEAEQKLQADARRAQEEAARKELEDFNRLREEQIQAARDTASAQIEAANSEYERTESQIRAEEQLGIISHRVAEQRLLDALQLRENSTQGALKDEQGLFNPALGQQQALEYQKLQNQMTKEAQRAALERERIVQQEATKMEQAYKKAAQMFNTDFERAFNQWAQKSETAGQAFGRMLGTMELQVINFVTKTILEHAEMWAMLKIQQAMGNATLKSQQALSDIQQVTNDAKVAAANAYAWGSSWGGPVAGAASAAVAFTAVEAFGVLADTGTMMPHMGFAFNASGSPERVLSPSQTSNFESLVNNGGSRSATLNQENHFGGSVTPEMLQAHTSQTMSKLRSMLRPEAFA